MIQQLQNWVDELMGPFREGSGCESWIQVSMALGYHEERKDEDKGIRPGGGWGGSMMDQAHILEEQRSEKCFGESLKETFSSKKYKGLTTLLVGW